MIVHFLFFKVRLADNYPKEYNFILIFSELAIISLANLVYYIRANLHEKCKNDATFQKSF